MILTYKYRIKDNSAHKALRRYAFAVNQVWNYCNSVQRDIEDRYRAGALRRRWPSDYDLQKLTSGTSKELGINFGTIEIVCKQYARSRDKKRRSLRFRASAGPRRALGWVPFRKQSRQIADNTITYMKKQFRWFGNARRPLPEGAKSGAFVEDAQGRWWVFFHVEVAEDRLNAVGEVGIDLGLRTLATLSDGRKIDGTQPYRRHATKLATAQRAHNKRRVRAIHAKIANIRKDYLHKSTCRIVRENGLIVVGNVNSTRLARMRMAKSVLDAGWATFRSQLRYKASRHGAVYLDIDERFTIQVCSCCGTIPDSSPKGMGGLGIREWECSDCGAVHDRDVNAAQNILRLGRAATPRVDESRLSVG